MTAANGQPLKCILAVIDPTTQKQWALDKAISIAQNSDDVKVIAYLCGYSTMECADRTELQKVELDRQNWWLSQIIDAADTNVAISKHLEWGQNWQKGAALTALQYKAELVVKAASLRPHELGSSDRQFLREVHGHVLLVNRTPRPKLRRVLLALNLNAADEEHQALNQMIITAGRQLIGDHEGVELHVVNACPDVDRFVHPPDLAKVAGVDRSQAHVSLGSPANVISQIANDIEADQVIIGTVKREGIAGLAIGNTAEKVLKNLDADVLVVSQTP